MENKRIYDQNRAPIYEALQTFRQMRVVPFDVPGHKRGRGNPELTEFLGEQCVSIDVNSMKPLDNLCHPISVIRQAEELAADAFGAAHAFLMVGGTTSSVQTMVLSVCKRGDKIIMPRNVHRSVINALVLCGAIPVYVNPEVDHRLGISLGMKRDQVAKAIQENPDAVAVTQATWSAGYWTSWKTAASRLPFWTPVLLVTCPTYWRCPTSRPSWGLSPSLVWAIPSVWPDQPVWRET